jgi:hypothetical protein
LDESNPEKDDEDQDKNLIEEVLTAEISNEFHTLKQAKDSPNWPRWDCVIQTELDQHQEKGTWELVDKLADIVPLTNKWVFVRKRDKEGCILNIKRDWW